MALVVENYPITLSAFNQKSDIQAVPVGQEDSWYSASDVNTRTDPLLSVARAVQLHAVVVAATGATEAINKKIARFDGTKLGALFRVTTSMPTDLNKAVAAMFEEIAQGGSRAGTPSGTAFFGKRVGVVSMASGTFVTGDLYTFSSDGTFPVTYASGGLPAIAIGLDARSAYLNLNGFILADNSTIEFTAGSTLKLKDGASAVFSSLTVNGPTDLNGTLDVQGQGTFSAGLQVQGLLEATSQALFNRTVNFTSLAIFQNIAQFEAETQYKHFSPAQITSDQDDFNVGNISAVRLSTDASRTITGLANGTDGRLLLISNIGSFDLILAHQNASSAAANRIISPTGANITLGANDSAILQYDNTTLRWRILVVSSDGGAVSSVFTRTGAVVAAASDYDASQVDNDSGVSGAFVDDALDVLAADIVLAGSKFHFYADQLDNPVTADWAINALAPAVADSNNDGLTVRLFDDTTEEGVGFILRVPTGATNIKLSFLSRAETAPGAVRTVGLRLYERGIPNNAAPDAWSAGTVLTDIDIPTNEFFQADTQTLTLATVGLTAGQTHQFELTRINPAGGTELVGDWDLLELIVEFT